VLRNPGNGLVISDVVDWLIGQESIVGDVSSEEDVPLERTVQEDKLYFWVPTLAIPIPIAGFGVWMGVRGRRKKTARDPGEAKDPKKPPPPAPAETDAAGEDEEFDDEEESDDESSDEEASDEEASDEEQDADESDDASDDDSEDGDDDEESDDEEEKR